MRPEDLTNQADVLKQMKADAAELLATLQQIKTTMEELPTITDTLEIQDLDNRLGSISGTMKAIIEQNKSDDFPFDSDGLQDLDHRLGSISGSMKAIIELSEEMPTPDSL